MAVPTPIRSAPDVRLLAGLLLVIGVAAVAWLAAAGLGSLPGAIPVSPVALAILLGLLWRNTAGVPPLLESGLQEIMQPLLRTGIALVGLRLTLDGIGATGLLALPVAVAGIALALGVSLLLGRLLGLPRPLALLLAVGTSVCGCTAVAAASPLVRARPADTGVAITCVVLLGTGGMLAYPWLARLVFGADPAAAGVFLGTAIHDTSQVMGAALIYGQQFGAPEVLPAAGFTKLLRNLSMLVLIPALALLAGPGQAGPAGEAAGRARALAVPPFLLAFLGFAVLRAAGDALFPGTALAAGWDQALVAALGLSEVLLVCGLAAVGLSVALGQVRRIALPALAVALLVALAVAASSLTLTTLGRSLAG